MIFQSTLPARGATCAVLRGECAEAISIHAPRTGSDLSLESELTRMAISIHAPRTGSDEEESDDDD